MSNAEKIQELVEDIQWHDENIGYETGVREGEIEEIMFLLQAFQNKLYGEYSNKGVENDDLMQTIRTSMIEAIIDYDSEKDSSAIRHIMNKTRNTTWNYYRKEMGYFKEEKITYSIDNQKGSIHTNGSVDLYDREISDQYADVESQVIKKLSLEEEIENLTPHQQEVLEMYYLKDMRQVEIAEELAIDQANVSRAKKRALNNLNARFSGEYDDMF